ncbi:hypothetical protein ACRAQ7_03710 [Erythrobacter sp. W53]|uniref:hypothetical protein n=1 Tax=Erythrobacter sp. W53 TaxID=3425947 RepID=UPI003D7689E1
MIEAGLVDGLTGKKMPLNSKKKSTASSYWLTDKLYEIAQNCGVVIDSILKNVPAERLVQLYGPKPRTKFSRVRGKLLPPKRGPRIEFEPTSETVSWTQCLEEINSFYRTQDIAIGLEQMGQLHWLAELNSSGHRKGIDFIQPETFSKDIYRVFNNGDLMKPQFTHGGRLFGGWWMNIPEELRSAITIGSQPTIELDYAACHPRMLYHLRGLDCDCDPYRLKEIAEYEKLKGHKRDTYRPCIKWLFQILLNGRGRPDIVDVPKEVQIPPGFDIKQLVDLIKTTHASIADSFETGIGLELMRLESDIALVIVTTAMRKGWAVLPIHDSFIATTDHTDSLRELMNTSYFDRLGKFPSFKRDPYSEEKHGDKRP